MDIDTVVRLAQSRGLLLARGKLSACASGGVEIAADAPRGWDVLGGWLSTVLGCISWPSQGGVTCVVSSRVLLRVVDPEVWRVGELARDVASSITGQAYPRNASAIARALWDTVGPSQYPDTAQVDLIKLPGFFYRKSIPGEYSNLTKYDLSNCYGTILSRMPSPYVFVNKSGAIKFKFKNLDRGAWEKVQECSLRSKHLGRALYGAALGSKRDQRRWNQGAKNFQNLPHGPFVPLGNLVARIAHEVTKLASEGAVYGYTDCVVHGEGEGVPLWDLAGLPYKTVASGDSEIVNPVCYRVGEDMTEHYRCGIRREGGKRGARYNVSIELVAGDDPLPQLFSSFLMAEGVNKLGV